MSYLTKKHFAIELARKDERYGTNNSLYKTYRAMKYRCYNPQCNGFINYGGKGVKICKEWNKAFVYFFNWAIANGYEEGLTIDRRNSNGNYEPSNCRWLTREDQNTIPNKTGKRRDNKTGYRGVTFCNTRQKYKAVIMIDGKNIHIGYYETIKAAAEARKNKEIEYFGKPITC